MFPQTNSKGRCSVAKKKDKDDSKKKGRDKDGNKKSGGKTRKGCK